MYCCGKGGYDREELGQCEYFEYCLSNIASKCELVNGPNSAYSGNLLMEHINLSSIIIRNFLAQYPHDQPRRYDELITKTAFIVADKLLNDRNINVRYILSSERTMHSLKEFEAVESKMLKCVQYISVLSQDVLHDMADY